EVAAVLDPESLGHRDLDRGEVVAVPDGLEDRVLKPEVEDLVETHLPEVMVDAVEPGLVDVVVQLIGERAGGSEVVSERLLDNDPSRLRETCLAEALDDGVEEGGWGFEVKDRQRGLADRLGQLLIGRRLAEVARDVVEPARGELRKLSLQLLRRRR